MVIRDPIEGDYPVKPPALILEILSPASIFKDRDIKFKLYQFYGVRYYLIANIDQQDIEYYVLKDNRYQQAGNLQEYQFLQDGTIKVSFSNIFQ